MMAVPSGTLGGAPGVMPVPSAAAQMASAPVGLPPGPGVMPPSGAQAALTGVPAGMAVPPGQQLPVNQPFGFGTTGGGGY
jgi:hypothetical protein